MMKKQCLVSIISEVNIGVCCLINMSRIESLADVVIHNIVSSVVHVRRKRSTVHVVRLA